MRRNEDVIEMLSRNDEKRKKKTKNYFPSCLGEIRSDLGFYNELKWY